MSRHWVDIAMKFINRFFPQFAGTFTSWASSNGFM